ncbi:hypothetical protein ABLB69_09665 [Xenorhabdus khoisanae]|uniref:hypothetical protein n=1 Tax=Xenorhabdus khoisanae TaxID=880157 RepID=UPI0032B71E44
MKNDVIELARETEGLQLKAAMELSNSWTMEKLLLTIAIVHHLIEKGNQDEAITWLEGAVDGLEEDILSEAESNSGDLNDWFNERMKGEISVHAALEIIRLETPAVEKIKTSLEEAVKKLAEYENMEPVAWGRHTGMNRTLDLTVLPERVTEWRKFNEAHPDIADDIFPLYRHPEKEPLKFTAEIELTDFTQAQDGKAVAFGKVFNDSKKRFPDGVEIITSLVINTETYKTDGYIKTQNSIYKIRE